MNVPPDNELPLDGLLRVVIEKLEPCIDGGRFAVKRSIGETLQVQADVFADGHDAVRCRLLYRQEGERGWQRASMQPLGNDRWQGTFRVQQLGRCLYTVEAWIDELATWQRDLLKRQAADQPLDAELLRGSQLVQAAAERAAGYSAGRGQEWLDDAERRAAEAAAQTLRSWAQQLADARVPADERVALAQQESLHEQARNFPDASQVRRHEPLLAVEIERTRARFSSWYEMFPRSAAADPGTHGTFADVEKLLPLVARMGFDVLYLPPIHPIGIQARRGPNNQPASSSSDPGSPWAIGSPDGGHKAIHPQLGTLEDFQRLRTRAAEQGIELALDIAFQCSPDHPYVQQHPEWFLKRPDGSIQYAENPPKQYRDIYPFHFTSPAWRELWLELASVMEFWVDQGVHIFRVDNPHTKPFAFWEWVIARLRRRCPEVIFLSEAFTRPKVMYRLAKLGFSQSYTYFTWRNTRQELMSYLRELHSTPVREFFRPNFWPNTPDILPEPLQFGGRAAFITRLILAATLAANYGIYGPAYELMEHEARDPGSEEYRDSEKYQLRHWQRERRDSLRELITLINRIRREHPALQSDAGLCFHGTDNDALIAYSKSCPEAEASQDVVLVVVNLDPHHVQSGWLQLDLGALGVAAEKSFQAQDLLSGAHYLWKGSRNYVALDPTSTPAHVLRIRRHVRSERDFDYFL